jgi:hypothetical protein
MMRLRIGLEETPSSALQTEPCPVGICQRLMEVLTVPVHGPEILQISPLRVQKFLSRSNSSSNTWPLKLRCFGISAQS